MLCTLGLNLISSSQPRVLRLLYAALALQSAGCILPDVTGRSSDTDPVKGSRVDAGPVDTGRADEQSGRGDLKRDVCGNGKREGHEICDGPDCPVSCPSSKACMIVTFKGSAATCDAECVVQEITSAKSGDGCCPTGADFSADSDCSKKCGDGNLDVGETCDPNSKDAPCPTACDDSNACTVDMLDGSAAQCTAECLHMPVIAAKDADMCCPQGASASSDSDCRTMTSCGNGRIDPGETCDGNCPSACTDGDQCTQDILLGHPDLCNVRCLSFSRWANVEIDDDGCPCVSDADCTRTDVCRNSICTGGGPSCAVDASACEAGRRCDVTQDSCVPIDCRQASCPRGTHCQPGLAQSVCVPDGTAGGLARAATDRGDTAVPPKPKPYSTCIYDQDCGGDLRCLQGTCSKICNSAEPDVCPATDLPGLQAVCDAECLFDVRVVSAPCDGQCRIGRIKTAADTPMRPKKCDADVVCPPAQVCVMGGSMYAEGPWLEQCIMHSCKGDSDCTEDAVCAQGLPIDFRYCVPKPS